MHRCGGDTHTKDDDRVHGDVRAGHLRLLSVVQSERDANTFGPRADGEDEHPSSSVSELLWKWKSNHQSPSNSRWSALAPRLLSSSVVLARVDRGL